MAVRARRQGRRWLGIGPWAVATALLAAHCGDVGTHQSPITNEGPAPDAGSPQVPGGGRCPVMGGASIPVPEAPTQKTVTVTVSQSVGGISVGHGLTVLNADMAPGARCGAAVQDGCVVRDCRVPEPQLGDLGATLPATSVGELAVMDGPTVATRAFGVVPRDRGSYLPLREMGVRWAANDPVCVRAAGAGAVPLFQAGVLFPQPPRDVWPRVADPVNEIVYIPRAEPLLVRWEPVAERVQVTLNQRAANGTTPTWMEDLSITCEFDGARGSATVPVSILRRFLSSPEGNSSGSINVSTVRAAALQAGVHPVVVRAAMGLSHRAEFR